MQGEGRRGRKVLGPLVFALVLIALVVGLVAAQQIGHRPVRLRVTQMLSGVVLAHLAVSTAAWWMNRQDGGETARWASAGGAGENDEARA